MEVRESMIDDLKASDNRKSAEVDKLKRELHQQNMRVKHLSEEVAFGRWERDRAVEQAESDCFAAQRLKVELEEERSALKKLREDSAQRESSLAEAQSHIVQLDSEVHRFEVIEYYRHSVFGKVEVALACKVGYDYLEAQLLAEMKSVPNHFHYPIRVANCLDALLEIEKQGGGLELGGSGAADEELDDEADEGSVEGYGEESEDSARQAGEGSTQDSWVISPEKKGKGVEPEVQSTPLPSPAKAPSRPSRGPDVDSSRSPNSPP